MIIEQLRLHQYRNYEQQTLTFSPTVNLLIGENAQGKTNALEAIHLLAMGKSHRGQRDSELMRFGAEQTRVEGRIQFQHHERALKLEFQPNGRKAYVNGIQQTKMTNFIGNFQVVLFAPEDSMLVKGSPGTRRRFIDMELGQTHPKYVYHLAQYARTMQQRNALLKRGTDETYLAVFDEQLITHGAQILYRRMKFLERMLPVSRQIYSDISNNREVFSFAYQCTIPRFELTAQSTLSEIEQALEMGLVSKHENDMRLGSTSVGPHRDDSRFPSTINQFMRMRVKGNNVQLHLPYVWQKSNLSTVRLVNILFCSLTMCCQNLMILVKEI